MINANMRRYPLYVYGDNDEYGQAQLSDFPIGETKIAIEVASQSIKDSIAYNGTSYVGLTHDELDETCVIDYGDKMLKVLYANNHGRLHTVYLECLS